MKKYNIIKLVNEKPYLAYGLEKDMRGIVTEADLNTCKVLFLNSQNIGEYTICNLNNRDVIRENEQLPEEIKNGNHYGDCVSVKIEDVRVIKNN